MKLRYLAALVAASCAAFAAGTAAAQAFLDLSAMTSPNYYGAVAMGVTTSGEVVLQSNVPPNVQYYHTYVYTGGTAGTYNEITSKFSSSTRAISVNNAGQMVVSASGTGYGGWYYTGGLDGTATLIPATSPSGLGVTYATAIDDAHEVGGGAGNATGEQSPYVYTGGVARDLPVPAVSLYPQYGGSVVALSPNGKYAAGYWNYWSGSALQVPYACAGYWTPNSGSWANGGAAADISSPVWGGGAAYPGSVAVAVNNAGQMVAGTGALIGGVGGSGTNECSSFLIYQIGTGATTPLTGLLLSYPKADNIPNQGAFTQCINGSGQVVGYEVVGSDHHAALWQNGTLIDLNTLFAPALPSGFVLNNATNISDNGYIVGAGTDAAGHAMQAFRLQLLPGDTNLDGKVDINDLSMVLANYDKTAGVSWSNGDVNGDGKVDINDLSAVLTNYDRSFGASATGPLTAAPEPGTLALVLTLGVLALLAAWRRRR